MKENCNTKKKRKRRSNGEGTVYQLPSRKWRGMLVVGKKDNGDPIRESFVCNTQREASDKISELKVRYNLYLLCADNTMTLSKWFHTWLFTYRKNDLKPATFERYEGIYRNYINNVNISNIQLKNLRTVQLQNYYNSLIVEKNKTAATIKTINK